MNRIMKKIYYILAMKKQEQKEDPVVLNRFRHMTAEEKLNLSLRLYYSARQLKTAAIKQLHPEWTEEEVENKVREIFLYARS